MINYDTNNSSIVYFLTSTSLWDSQQTYRPISTNFRNELINEKKTNLLLLNCNRNGLSSLVKVLDNRIPSSILTSPKEMLIKCPLCNNNGRSRSSLPSHNLDLCKHGLFKKRCLRGEKNGQGRGMSSNFAIKKWIFMERTDFNLWKI